MRETPPSAIDTLPPESPIGASDAARQRNEAAKQKVRRYYIAATDDYLKYYQADWHHHMHYGFDRDLPKGGNPTEQMVKYMASVAGLLPPWETLRTANAAASEASQSGASNAPRVLDAGCGVGGSAIWLAEHAGCKSVGITLVEVQTRLAMGFSCAHGVAGKARFVASDFTLPAFKPSSFDVVWALESFDHAPDKRAWVRGMFSLLKPGGRLIIADGFRSEDAFDPKQKRAYDRFLAGWAVPHLCTAREMEDYAREAGFETAHAEDISRDVMPHALAIFRFGLLFIPWRWIRRKLGLTSDEKLGNAYATYYQYLTFRRGFWSYRIYCFRKPG